jgi:hypothetical protein
MNVEMEFGKLFIPICTFNVKEWCMEEKRISTSAKLFYFPFQLCMHDNHKEEMSVYQV